VKYNTLQVKTQGNLALLTLTRPRNGNPVDDALAGELDDACRTLNEDDCIHAVILTGSPRGPFSLGEDLSAPRPTDVELPHPPPASTACRAVASLKCPVIAALGGDATGAGLELAMSCDIRIVSATARLSLPQVVNGVMPSGGGTQQLPRLVGKGKAIELLLLGGAIDANEALRIGLVNEIAAPSKLTKRANEMAQVILSRGPIGVRYAKEAVGKGMDMTLAQGLRLEADLNIILQTTFDRAEGVNAFMEKRKAHFKGV